MKIAVISDVHSNFEALKATFEDIEKRNVDKIICLGDIIAKGVHPKECIKLVREKCDVVLQGNCDKHFSKVHQNLEELPKLEQERIKWNQSMLNDEDRAYLSNLPYCYEFYMSGSLIRLFHASPSVINGVVLNTNSITQKYDMFLPSENTLSQEVADVVIYGHIHHPYLDVLYNKTLINIGSVGNSFNTIRNESKDSTVLETTKSHYLIIEGDFGSTEYTSEISYQFVKVPYDIQKELEDEHLNIEKDNYTYELTQGMYRDMTKVYEGFKKQGIDITKI